VRHPAEADDRWRPEPARPGAREDVAVGLFWFITIPFVIALTVVTIVDIFRRKNGGGTIAAWVLLVVVLPVIGSIIYWATRKPTAADVEEAYLAEADTRSHNQRLPTDRAGF
jgi:hypothetical protein